jgi:hypothetical protein
MTFETDGIRGVVKNFGTRTATTPNGAIIDDDKIKTAIWTFDYDNLPTSSTNTDWTLTLPAGAIPLEAYFQVNTAFAGGTSYDIDFVDSAGNAIGSGTDKLWDLIALIEIDTSVTVVSSNLHGGTNSGNAMFVPLASAGQLKVTAAGTFTAGNGSVIVRYLNPGAVA